MQGQEKFFQTAQGRNQPASAQISENPNFDQMRGGQPKIGVQAMAGYATVGVANTLDNKQHGVGGVGIQNLPKVPTLALGGDFNLADAPLRRLHDANQYKSVGSTQDNGPMDHQQFMSTNQNILTTEMDALRRPPVTVKQTDIIFLPDKGLDGATVSFDVSRKQANLTDKVPDQMMGAGGSKSNASSARGSSADRNSVLNSRVISQGAASSNTYRGTSVLPPVSHHYQDLGDLMLLSRHEASLTHRMHIRDNLKARTPLGCPTFQGEINRGILAFATSPDGHSVAIMTLNFDVLIHDKVREKTFTVKPLEMDALTTQVSIEGMLNQRQSFGGPGGPLAESFKLYVSNGITNIYVLTDSERVIATWSNMLANKPSLKSNPTAPGDQRQMHVPPSPSTETRTNRLIGGLQRSNSASRIDEKKPRQQARSSSRLRDFFRPSSIKKALNDIPSSRLAGQNNKVMSVQTGRNSSQGRLVEPQSSGGRHQLERAPQPVEFLSGRWTNITMHSQNKQDMALQTLASSNTMQYSAHASQEVNFQTGLPVRYGNSQRVDFLGHFQDEGSLISVRMYDYASYIDIFNSQLYNDITYAAGPQDANQKLRDVWYGFTDLNKMDNDTRKVLVFSQQFVEQDKIYKGGVWYQNPFYLVDKAIFATEIEYMGLLQDQGAEKSIKRTLISSCDNQGNLLAVAVNSMHKIYCQILFVSLKNQFVSVMKLFEFVSAEDNPPFDTTGKTNLQIDDLQWTRNDAFVILMFNTGALAVLPRLGSQLLKIYNPTIINVHYNDAANFTQYKVPRGFNELIPKTEIQAKVRKWKQPHIPGKIVSANGSSGYRLSMHPSEDAFIIYSGSIAYIMQLELEPELEELFDQENKNYYFMRFCFSMKSLSRDQETLSKIPQLLTSKLPICEFEKNQEKLDNNDDTDIGKRIQTASQINPWQMEDRRMDTIQSFDADFKEEAQRVLLNFKHLLFAYRWNAATTLNYLEWLVTITNDIFFYYLKHSEPMYAYHSLKISEFYMCKVLEKSRNVNQYQVLNSKQSDIIMALGKKTYDNQYELERPDEEKMEQVTLLGRMFTGMLKRQMDPVYEIYSHGIASQTLMKEVAGENQTGDQVRAELANLMPPKKTLAQKIATKTDYLDNLPILVASGDGNQHFAFQKNYALLSYYCLIQFRNYQANNFNILFLIIASYIFKKHVNASFISGLHKISSILFENFLQLEKTNELDLFFGKCGKNVIQKAPQKLSFIQKWCEHVSPHQSSYIIKVLNQKTISQIQEINYKIINDTTAQVEEEKKKDEGQEIRIEVKPMIDFISSLEKLDFASTIDLLKDISATFKVTFDMPNIISPTQQLGICQTLFASMMYQLAVGRNRQETHTRTLSFSAAIECIVRMSIKLDKKSPINTVSNHTKIFDAAFVNNQKPKTVKFAKQRLCKELDLTCEADYSKFTAMLLAYTGDFYRAAKLLKPQFARGANMDLILFNVLLQSQTLKIHSTNFLYLIDLLQDYSMKNIKDLKQLHQTTERLNSIQVVKYTMAEVSCTMNRVMSAGQNSLFYREYLWACFQMLPHGVAVLFKEQAMRDAIINIKTIFKQQIASYDQDRNESFTRKLVLSEFPLAESFFEKTLEGCCEHLEHILPAQTIIRRRFFQQLEIVLICLYDQHEEQMLYTTAEKLLAYHRAANKQAQSTSNDNHNVGTNHIVSQRVTTLIIKSITKFGKIFSYLKIRSNIRQMDNQILHYKQASATKTTAMVEAQIMICCNSLQHMIHFPKYTLVQSHIRRGLTILTQLLFHTHDVLKSDVLKKVLLPVIDKIIYSKYNRANKQLCSSILEMCKEKTQSAPDQYSHFVSALEAAVFDKASQFNNTIKPKHIQREDNQAPPPKRLQPNSQEAQDLSSMLEQVVEWMTFQILPSLDWKKLNYKGHRRCINAKKDMLRLAYTMHSKLGLRMTDCSFFFRGVNFEVKHVNVFNLKDADMQSYAEFLAKDLAESEQTKLEAKNKEPVASGKAKEEEEKKDDDDKEDEMNKTCVEKMADESVQYDINNKGILPELDFKLLVMGKHQLFPSPDLPQNCDLGDTVTMEGDDCLRVEMQTMEYRRRLKKEKIEQEATQAQQKIIEDKQAAADLAEKESLHIKNRSSFTVGPRVFSNSIGLSELDLAEVAVSTTEETNATNDAAAPLESSRGNEATDEGQNKEKSIQKMGRIFARIKRGDAEPAPSGVKKITLRKNSMRRKIAVTDQILNLSPAPKPAASKGIDSRRGIPPKPRGRLPPRAGANNQAKPLIEESKEHQAAKKKRLQPFNLVFLKRNKVEATGEEDVKELGQTQMKSQTKVKVPLKMIAKNFKAGLEKSPESSVALAKDDTENKKDDQRQKKKVVKPFQVQIIKVNKTSKSKAVATAKANTEASPTVEIKLEDADGADKSKKLGEADTETKPEPEPKPPVELYESTASKFSDVRYQDKREFMIALMKQLDHIQDRADTLKQDLAANPNNVQSSRKHQ